MRYIDSLPSLQVTLGAWGVPTSAASPPGEIAPSHGEAPVPLLLVLVKAQEEVAQVVELDRRSVRLGIVTRRLVSSSQSQLRILWLAAEDHHRSPVKKEKKKKKRKKGLGGGHLDESPYGPVDVGRQHEGVGLHVQRFQVLVRDLEQWRRRWQEEEGEQVSREYEGLTRTEIFTTCGIHWEGASSSQVFHRHSRCLPVEIKGVIVMNRRRDGRTCSCFTYLWLVKL